LGRGRSASLHQDLLKAIFNVWRTLFVLCTQPKCWLGKVRLG
jgi:hypothetical protein